MINPQEPYVDGLGLTIPGFAFRLPALLSPANRKISNLKSFNRGGFVKSSEKVMIRNCTINSHLTTTSKDNKCSRDMTQPIKWLCAQRRLRSAWASARSDHSLRCPHEKKNGFLVTHWAHSEDSDQTERMPRLIWVFAGRTLILLVLACRGSNAALFRV